MAIWKDEVKNCKTSKQDVLKELKREMEVRNKVYTEWIRKQKITKHQAIKRCAALRHAYLLIKKWNEEQNGVQKELF
jgi:hypothetical protein